MHKYNYLKSLTSHQIAYLSHFILQGVTMPYYYNGILRH